MAHSLLSLSLVHTCRFPLHVVCVYSTLPSQSLGLHLSPLTLQESTAQPCPHTFPRSAIVLEKEGSPTAQRRARDPTWECLSGLWFSALAGRCWCDFWLPFLVLFLMESWPELTRLTEFMGRMSDCSHILLKYPS